MGYFDFASRVTSILKMKRNVSRQSGKKYIKKCKETKKTKTKKNKN